MREIYCNRIGDYIEIGDIIYAGEAYTVKDANPQNDIVVCTLNHEYREDENIDCEKKVCIKVDGIWGKLIPDIEDFIKNIRFTYKPDLEREDLITREHRAYKCTFYHKGRRFTVSFQFNPNYCKDYLENTDKLKVEALRGAVLDYYAYADNRNVDEFAKCFGYDEDEGITALMRAYKGCKKTYENMQRVFRQEEIYSMNRYFDAVDRR